MLEEKMAIKVSTKQKLRRLSFMLLNFAELYSLKEPDSG